MATLAAIAGAQLPPNAAEDSYNLLPVLRDNAPSPRQSLVHNTKPNAYAVRHENWVLIAAATGAQSKVPEWFNPANGYADDDLPGELYDLAADPAQKRNLFADRPDKVKELTALLATIRAKGQAR
jgi:arylsulfatase A